jgi:hypothetical protein
MSSITIPLNNLSLQTNNLGINEIKSLTPLPVNPTNPSTLNELARRINETLATISSIEDDFDSDSDLEIKIESTDKIGEKEKEKKEHEMIINLFSSKWSKILSDNLHKNNLSYAEIKPDNCRIKNVHGLEFYGYKISYDIVSKKYTLDFKINKYVDGIKSKLNKDQFVFRSTDLILKKAFTEIMEKINMYVFCIHCVYIVKEENYFLELSKCESCLLTDLLSLKKAKGEYCSICQDDTKNYYILPCGHKFHRACLSKCTIKICPLCRKDMNDE